MDYLLISILIMTAMTYLPKLLPLLLFKKPFNNRWIRSFLYYLPYAVLTAMTIPAIFTSTAFVGSAVAGTVAALLMAWFDRPMIAVAIVGSATVWLVELIAAI
ncbi:MAG: AzlD domain-containing protein [Fastidiosipilaceae bacterium]